MDNSLELRFELLGSIHKYYPIGMPFSTHRYPGYKRLLNILEEKIITLQNEGRVEPWATLVEGISSQIKNIFVLDMAYAQFPCYILRLDLSKNQIGEVEQSNSIFLSVSLLTNHYTIFFSSDYKFLQFDSKVRERALVLSLKVNTEELEKVEVIKKEMSKYFPKHNFVHHIALFNYKVKDGYPHGLLTNYGKESYSIYHYLFGPYPEEEFIFKVLD